MEKPTKPFKSYHTQIKILKERGLIIKPTECKRVLQRENYYNIINGYKEIFLDKNSKEEKYLNGTTFDNIYSLYCFDEGLRNLFLKYILKFETLLKTKVSYFHSKYHNIKFNFFDVNNFQGNSSKITKLISTISNDINKNNIDNIKNSFSHYLNKHGELPLWVYFQKSNFGVVCYFFEVLKSDIKKEINDEINEEFKYNYKIKSNNIIDANKLENLAHFLNKYRNICAHNERLYFESGKRFKNKKFFLDYSKYTTQQYRGNIFDLLVVLKIFLLKKDFNKLIEEFEVILEELKVSLNNLPNIYSHIENSHLNIPKNWKELLLKFWL
ncbi:MULTISPECIES: Abi family protein [Streptobacillus]|uniref:Abi family protein n=1 Tax=Streptobacillus TaxID=34104 RepID=UPI0007E3325C|nr:MULTISPECIES: Abi family protein [Streptobacillus]